jgi:hypothetical protein
VLVGLPSVEVQADEPGDVVGARFGGDRPGVALLHHAPVLDDDEPVGQHERVERVVRDEQRRPRMLREVALQLGARLQPRPGIQRGQRFIEQQQIRLYGESPGQRHPLRLASGELPGLRPGLLGQPDAAQPVGRLRPGGRAVDAAAPRPERDIVQRAQVRKEQVVLEHHADRPALGRDRCTVGRLVEYTIGQADVSGREWQEAGQGPQGRGLAGPVRAEERHDLAGGHADRQVEPEGPAVDNQVGVEKIHEIHLSRRLTRIVTDTTRSRRLRTTAASRSVSSAR